ncbi:hypothetical protein [Lutibacter maritimus]|uniref:Calx-beta domain-containing protein n=1 Tax=Lutibacter maritimus TaxID=593133 RepID=A0A1I6R6T7_9FLAO|nr:hypothetical protein [Lutibacter maritimus]SFS60389.1 hypothetical protein SAMN04488006_2308 [Lutibacter maritimus]
MKKTRIKLNFFIVVLLASFTVSSCLLDDEKTDFGKGPILAQFEKPSVTANFIKDGSVTPYNVAITIIGGKNKPLNEPVDITISADPSSTATSGVEYSLAATTFTIPAGEMSVDAVINVNTANLDPFDAKTLVLKIDSSSESVSESNLAAITLQAVCSLDLNGFVGTYTAVNARFANPLTATVELGPLPNSLLLTNIDGYGDDEVLIVLSTDVVNPTITYAGDANYYIYNHSTYGPVWATTLTPEQSTYNSCDFSLNLEFKRCVSIGCFGGSRVVKMTKQ